MMSDVAGCRAENQLDKALIRKASKALLRHLQATKRDDEAHQSLLGPDDALSNETIWLIASTKKHIVAQKRLKPAKVLIPHSLNTQPALSICLIVPDPQRDFKDVVAHPSFTPLLANHIERIVDIKKLEKKYHSFESKRQLRSSHDLFLADDRIITYLPKIMGKIFYSSTSKRPIPVCLRPRKLKEESTKTVLPKVKTRKDDLESTSIVGPSEFAQEIERTLRTTSINLSPSSATAVRIGLASFTPNQLAENVEAVTIAMVEKFVPKKWRGLKALHMKGPNSLALPIWLAEELWEDEAEVLEDSAVKQRKTESFPKEKRPKMLEQKQECNLKSMRSTGDVVNDENMNRIKRRRVEIKDYGRESKEQRQQLRQRRREMREKLKTRN